MKKIHRHRGYVERIDSRAKWLVRTHTAQEIREVLAVVKEEQGEEEARYLREKTMNHWKAFKLYGVVR